MQKWKKISFNSILVFFVLLFTTMPTGAATITVSPLDSEQAFGEDFTLKIIGTDFTSGTSGGGLNVSWDPTILSVDNLSDLDITFAGDMFFASASPPTLDKGDGSLDFSVSSFWGVDSTDFDIAEITFTAIGLGQTQLDLTVSSLDVWADYDSLIDVNPNAVDGSVSAVPIPGALWLLGSGLIGMLGVRRKLAKS